MIRAAASSIRVRLALASALVAAVILGSLGVLIAAQLEDAASSTATALAVDDLRPFLVDLRGRSDEEPDPSAAGVFVLVQAPDGSVRRDSMPVALSRAVRSVRALGDVTIASGRFRVAERSVAVRGGTWRVWAARDLTASEALLSGIRMTLLLGIPAAVVIIAGAAWLVAGGALRPVGRMRATADRLRAPDATGTLPVQGGRQLAELATTLNSLIEELRERAALERRVTADAAHELRTPLAVLSAQVEQAQRHPDDADLPAIRASVGRLSTTADSLLALSRAEAGGDGSSGSAAVQELVTEAMDAVDRFRLLAGPGVLVDLELRPPIDERSSVALDVPAFGRVLANLVADALAAGPASSVQIVLSAADGQLGLEVVDDGSGVPEDFLPFAFDRFARPERSRSDGSAGTGLGLALVERLVRRAGGAATLRNRAEGGAVAAVLVPLGRGRDPG